MASANFQGLQIEFLAEENKAPGAFKGVQFESAVLSTIPILFKGVSFEDTQSKLGPKFLGVQFEDLTCFGDTLLDVTSNIFKDVTYCNMRDVCDEITTGLTAGHIFKKTFQVKAGGFTGPLDPRWQPDCDQTFNFTKCGADSDFFQPVQIGDILYFQTQFEDVINAITPGGLSYGWDDGVVTEYLLDGVIVDYCTGATVPLRDHWGDRYVGIRRILNADASTSYEPVQGFQLDTTLVPFDCFQIKLTKYNDLTQTSFEEFCCEPYKIKKCDRTFKIQSDFDLLDGFSQDYREPFEVFTGTGGVGFGHVNTMRIPGSVELDSVAFTRTVISNTTREINSQQSNIYKARTFPLPEFMIRVMANVLNGPDIRVDEVIRRMDGVMEKDLETGTMWTTEITFQDNLSQSDFDCET